MRWPWRRAAPRRVQLRIVVPPGDVILSVGLAELVDVVHYGYPEAREQWCDLVQLPGPAWDFPKWLTCRVEVREVAPEPTPAPRRRGRRRRGD